MRKQCSVFLFFYLILCTYLKYCKCKIQRKILCIPIYSARIPCKFSKDGRSAGKSRTVGQDMQPRQAGEGSGKLEMLDDRLERQVGMGTGQDRQPRQPGEGSGKL